MRVRSEGNEDRRMKLEKVTWAIRCLGITLSLLFGVYVYSQEAPFEPYRVHGYLSVPDTVCPGATVEVSVDRSFYPTYDVSAIDVTTFWQDLESGSPVSATELTFSKNTIEELPKGREIVPLASIGEIPTSPGEYRVVTVFVIKGRVIGFRRTDTVRVRTGKVLTVLSGSEPQCMNQTRGERV